MRSEHDKTVQAMFSLDERLYKKDPTHFIKGLRQKMSEAVEELDFESFALIRDEIYHLESKQNPLTVSKPRKRKPLSGG